MKLIYFCLSLAFASISFPLYKKSPSDKLVKKHAFVNTTSSNRELLASSAITNYQDLQYYAQATIGTPPQTFTFTIDTGSTWIWIDSNSCSNCHSGTKFNSSSSSTYYNTQTAKTLTYLQGNSNGYLSTDVISIGDNSSLYVTNQSFILVSDESSFDGMKSDGLIGFAFDSLSDGYSSLLTSLKTQGKIKNRQFAIYLSEENSYSDLPNLGNSSLMIDGYDLSAYSSENSFTYIDLSTTSDGYWEISCDAVYYDGKTYSSSHTAIIDTGTSVIIGPKNDVNNILLDLYNNYGCKIDSSSELYCSCTGTYPNLTFQFSSHNFTLHPSDYFEVSQGYCFPALYYSTQINAWVLGDSFIRRFYINFDMDGLRLGFAKVGINTSTNSSSSANSTSSGSSGSDSSTSSSNSTSSSSSSSNSTSSSSSSSNSTSSSSNSTSTSSSGSSSSSNSTSTSNSSSSSSQSSSSSSSDHKSLSSSSSDSGNFETWKIVLIVVLPSVFFIIVFVISAVAIAKIIKKRKQKRYEVKLSGSIEVKIQDAEVFKSISHRNTEGKNEDEVVKQELNRNHG